MILCIVAELALYEELSQQAVCPAKNWDHASGTDEDEPSDFVIWLMDSDEVGGDVSGGREEKR